MCETAQHLNKAVQRVVLQLETQLGRQVPVPFTEELVRDAVGETNRLG